eukprot:XP_011674058.1 PREDICTED: uncharacterized protein LOC105442991 [Strongylocentrotus purpuratus]
MISPGKAAADDMLPVVLLLQEHKAYCKYTDCSSNPCPSDEDCVETINGFHCLARANPTTTDIVPRIVPTTTMTTTTTTMKDTTTALTTSSKVTSLAIDEDGRRLFAACRASYISSVNLNGSQLHRIYLRNVYNVIVAGDAVITTNDSRKLLLASTWDGGIYHMELNGTDKQLVHAVKGKHLTITWDKECRRIFYAYRDAEFTIQVVDITGENHRILITHARLQIEGLAYYDGYVYWTNSNTNVRDYGTGIGKISSEANNTQYYEFYPQSWSGYEIIARGDLKMREFE